MSATASSDVHAHFRRQLRVWVALPSLVMLALVAAYRFSTGQGMAGWIDVAWAAGIVGGLMLSRRPGQEDRGGTLMALFSSAGCAATIHLVGLPTMFWLFPVLLGNFAVAPRPAATVLSLLAVASVALFSGPMVDAEGHLAFVIAAAMAVVFAVVSVIHMDRLHRQLSDLAHRDALTGTGNRRAFEQTVRQMLCGDDAGMPFALAVLDLDHFKLVNDEHGHAAGDRVLAELTSLVHRLKRPRDAFYRIGGEEFALLMPRTGAAEARGELELIVAAVRQKIRVRNQPVTVSIGLAMREPDDGLPAWMSRADRALYEAKRTGRDRVVEATAPPETVEGATLQVA